MIKRLISILLVFLVLFSSLLSVKVISAEEDDFDTDKEEISEVTDDTSDEEDISVAEKETDIEIEENSAPGPEPEEINQSVSDASAGAAYAILTEEGDLIFFRSEADYTNGSTYTVEINDSDYTGVVYTGIETLSVSDYSQIPWYSNRELIKAVNVATNEIIKPISTAWWFYGCSNLDSFDGVGFDTSNTEYMGYMFEDCVSLKTLDLSDFNTSNTTSMRGMFEGCFSLSSLDISSFDTKNIKWMYDIFNNCASLETIEIGSKFTNWIDLAYLPRGVWTNKNLNLAKTEIELYQDYPSHASEWAGTWTRDESMLGNAYALLTNDGNLIFFRESANYSNGSTYIVRINDRNYTGIVYKGFETLNITELGHNEEIPWYSNRDKIKKAYVADNFVIRPASTAFWFKYCTNLVSVSFKGFIADRNTSMFDMFSMCTSLKDISFEGFDTVNVKNMRGLFYGCESLETLDLGSLNTSNVTDTSYMFDGCSSLVSLDLRSINTSKAEDMFNMFNDCLSLEKIVLGTGFTKWEYDAPLPEGNWINRNLGLIKSDAELRQQYPSHASEWAGTWEKYIPVESLSLNESSITLSIGDEITLVASVLPENAFDKTVSWASSDSSIAEVDENGKVTALSVGTAIIYATSNDKTSIKAQCEITVEDAIPENGYAYAVLIDKGDLIFFRSFETYENNTVSEAKDVYGNEYSGTVFSNVESSESVPWKDQIYNIIGKVYVAEGQIISPINMYRWFQASKIQSFDGHGFDTSNVINMSHMFDTCKSLTSVDLSTFDTSNVTNMRYMFGDCTSLTSLDLSSFDTRNVTNMEGMFNFAFSENSHLMELDLSSFNTRNVEQMNGMFGDCKALHTIKLGSGFTVWKDDTELPVGTWFNQRLGISKTEVELVEQYPSHASDWAGTWTKINPVTSIELDKSELILNEGETAQLYVTVLSEDATIKELSWSSSNEETVTVDENGLVTAVKEGEADITVSTTDGSELSARCIVKVYGEDYYGDILPEDRPDDPNDIPTGLWTSELSDVFYTGKAVKQDFRVYDYKTLLTEGTDYTVKYTNNTKAGTATVTITGKGNYVGTLVVTFNILPLDISSAIVTLNKDVFAYSGKALKPTVSSVVYEGKKLKANTDYTISYLDDSYNVITNPILPGDYYVKVTGKGNYDSNTSVLVSYRIVPKDITPVNTLTITLAYTKTAYDGTAKEPSVTIKKSKTVLDNSLFKIEYFNNIEVGTASVVISSLSDDYVGSATKTFNITGTALSKVKLTGVNTSYTYTGEEIRPEPVLAYNSKVLVPETDYVIAEYLNNIEIGTATIALEGRGGYTGTVKKTFKITGTSFTTKTIGILSGFGSSKPFTGEEVRQDSVKLYLISSGAVLKPVGYDSENPDKGDYTVSYKNNINAGTATITFKGANAYTGSFSKTYKITKAAIKDSNVSIESPVVCVKGGAKPLPDITVNGTVLEYNRDYTLTYKNNTKPGTASITVKGKGNYEGSVSKNFTITPASISDVSISIPDKAYSNKSNAWRSTPVLTDSNGKKLVSGTDYEKTIIYKLNGRELTKNDIVPEGSVINVTVIGKGNYEGTKQGSYRIVTHDLSKATATIPNQYYTGKPITLIEDEITVKVGKTVIDPSSYRIVEGSYVNNTAKGTAKVTIQGIGSCGGTKTASFKIVQRSLGIVIHFDGNGATSGTMKDQIIYKNNVALTKNAFKRTVNGVSVKFLGWNTKPDGSGIQYDSKYTDYSIFKAGQYITLYAMWEDTSEESETYPITITIPKNATQSEMEEWCSRYDFVSFKTETTKDKNLIAQKYKVVDQNGNELKKGQNVTVDNSSFRLKVTYYVEKEHTLNLVTSSLDGGMSIKITASADGDPIIGWYYDDMPDFVSASKSDDGSAIKFSITGEPDDDYEFTVTCETEYKSAKIKIYVDFNEGSGTVSIYGYGEDDFMIYEIVDGPVSFRNRPSRYGDVVTYNGKERAETGERYIVMEIVNDETGADLFWAKIEDDIYFCVGTSVEIWAKRINSFFEYVSS